MPTFSSLEAAVLSVSSVIFLVFSCVSLSSFYLWLKVADTYWMKPRWSKWQMSAFCTVSFCYLGPRCSLAMWSTVWIKQPPNHRSSDSSAQRTADLLSILALLCIVLIWLVLVHSRMWLSYFGAKLCLELEALEWKQLIDTRQRDDSANWFVANQNTWGSRSHVLKIGTPLTALFIAAMLVSIIFLNNQFINFLFVFILIFNTGVWVLFVKKYPAFHDCIHLHEEAAAMVRVSVVFVILYVIGSIGRLWVKPKDDSLLFVLTVAMRQLINSLFILVFQMTCVNYVAFFFEKPSLVICGIPLLFHVASDSFDPSEESRGQLATTRSHTRVNTSSPTRERQQLFSSASDKRVDLRTVLRDDIGCRLLMSHLISELSHENMLALIECVKFRERMAAVCGVQLEESDKLRAANLFGSEVNDTQSSIVADMHSPNDAPQVYAALCRKYVADTSATSINLSYLQRSYALSLMETGSELDPFCLDRIIQQCVVLLSYSFTRFSRTEEFAKFASEYTRI